MNTGSPTCKNIVKLKKNSKYVDKQDDEYQVFLTENRGTVHLTPKYTKLQVNISLLPLIPTATFQNCIMQTLGTTVGLETVYFLKINFFFCCLR
jgi:hypothetical protein